MENGSFTATLSASVHESAETHLTRIFIFNFLPSMHNVFHVAPLHTLKPSTHARMHTTVVVWAKYLKGVSRKRAALAGNWSSVCKTARAGGQTGGCSQSLLPSLHVWPLCLFVLRQGSNVKLGVSPIMFLLICACMHCTRVHIYWNMMQCKLHHCIWTTDAVLICVFFFSFLDFLVHLSVPRWINI